MSSITGEPDTARPWPDHRCWGGLSRAQLTRAFARQFGEPSHLYLNAAIQ